MVVELFLNGIFYWIFSKAPMAEAEEAIPTYSEAFPSLPTNGEGSEASKSSGEWTTPKIQRIKSSVVTQVGG